MSLPIGSVLVLRTPPDDTEYPYREVEVTGVHRLSESEVELVVTSVHHFAPNFTIAESALNRAGYDLDIPASEALKQKRADRAAEEAAARESAAIAMPWELPA